MGEIILAPLRGVTIRAFRETFSSILSEGGFSEAFTPFITANPGVDPLKDRELKGYDPSCAHAIKLTPQFIGKDPKAFRECLKRIKDVGFTTADLNCGCPFPMVRNKFRGSGILKTPKILEEMIRVGTEEMGDGNFSIKTRLGVDDPDELKKMIPVISSYPLRFITVHGRVARQMYEGTCDKERVEEIVSLSRVKVVRNGDIAFPADETEDTVMIGRAFIRYLGMREDAEDLLNKYIEVSCLELAGDRPVLGRIKEFVAYWQDLPFWRRRWQIIKIARSLEELRSVVRT